MQEKPCGTKPYSSHSLLSAVVSCFLRCAPALWREGNILHSYLGHVKETRSERNETKLLSLRRNRSIRSNCARRWRERKDIHSDAKDLGERGPEAATSIHERKPKKCKTPLDSQLGPDICCKFNSRLYATQGVLAERSKAPA